VRFQVLKAEYRKRCFLFCRDFYVTHSCKVRAEKYCWVRFCELLINFLLSSCDWYDMWLVLMPRKSKAVLLLVMLALGGGGIAPTYS
jgi:hypothetical protein